MTRFAWLLLLLSLPAQAQEAWCTANPSNCVGAENFQSTSYNRVSDFTSGGCWIGSQTNSKPLNDMNMCPGYTGSVSLMGADGGMGNTFAGRWSIATDSATLNLLPNRNPSAVARYVRTLDDAPYNHGVARFGYINIPTGTTKRMALRWYSYHSSNYQWATEGTCTNGKIAHLASASFGVMPYLTMSNFGPAEASIYSFGNINGWTWHATGYGAWSGFVYPNDGATRPRPSGQPAWSPSNQRGKWYRHEIVVRRPRVADSNAGGLGFDFSYFVQNVTDNTQEVEVFRLSSPCSLCVYDGLAYPGINWTWNTGVYPSGDITAIHTEFFRETDGGNCSGWMGYAYAVVARWDTDAGQRIGAASEVEGGGGLSAPTNVRRTAMAP